MFNLGLFCNILIQLLVFSAAETDCSTKKERFICDFLQPGRAVDKEGFDSVAAACCLHHFLLQKHPSAEDAIWSL